MQFLVTAPRDAPEVLGVYTEIKLSSRGLYFNGPGISAEVKMGTRDATAILNWAKDGLEDYRTTTIRPSEYVLVDRPEVRILLVKE